MIVRILCLLVFISASVAEDKIDFKPAPKGWPAEVKLSNTRRVSIKQNSQH